MFREIILKQDERTIAESVLRRAVMQTDRRLPAVEGSGDRPGSGASYRHTLGPTAESDIDR